MNQVTLIGRVGGNAKVQEFKGGSTKLTFRLAVSKWISKDDVPGWNKAYSGSGSERTIWATINGWGNQTDLAPKLLKGTHIMVECELDGDTEDGVCRPHSYQAKDGEFRTEFTFRLARVHFLDVTSATSMWLIGNLGADPEASYLPDDTALCKFSVAVNKFMPLRDRSPEDCPKGWLLVTSKKNGAEEVIGFGCVEWWRATAWGGTAEYANKVLSKGRKVVCFGEIGGTVVDGVMRPYVYDDGTASYEITVRRLIPLGNGNGNGVKANREDWAADQPLPF